MALIFSQRLDDIDFVGLPGYTPGMNGRSDLGTFHGVAAYPPTNGVYPGGNGVVRGGTLNIGSRTIKTLDVYDSGAGSYTLPTLRVDLSKLQAVIENSLSLPLTTWSASFIMNPPTMSGGEGPNGQFFSVRNSAGTYVWGLYQEVANGTNRNRFYLDPVSPWLGWSTGSLINQALRFEVQVDSARTPQVTVRCYTPEGTAVQAAHIGNAPTGGVGLHQLFLGDVQGVNTAYTWQFGEVMLWNTYDADGQFTSNPTSPTAASTTATGWVPPAPTIPADQRDGILPSTASFTSTTYQYASSPGTYRTLDLHTPTGTAPANGWPVAFYIHGGFGTSGARGDIPANLRNELINLGFAVADVEYVRSSVTTGGYSAYGTTYVVTGLPGYGRFESQIADVKLAIARLKSKSTGTGAVDGIVGDGTYNLDVNNFVACGHSWGGYLALLVAATRELTSDGAPTTRNLKLSAAANATYNDGYAGNDPHVQGVYVWSAPTDLQDCMNKNWAEGGAGSLNTFNPYMITPVPGTTVRGPTASACQAILAQNQSSTYPTMTNTDVANMIGLNAANMVPVFYAEGIADNLVSWSNQVALDGAMTFYAGSIPAHPSGTPKYTATTQTTNHEDSNTHYRYTDLQWMVDLVATGGGPGPGPVSVGGVPSIPSIPVI